MFKQYSLLKGTISQLQIIDDPKELGSDNNVSLIAMIGELFFGVFEVVASLVTTLSEDSITLEGKKFSCYVGRKFVEGKLTHISFKNGDYVEMVVDKSDNNQYQSYAVRIPKTHALYFPHAVDTPALLRLKYCAIGSGVLCLLTYLIGVVIVYFSMDSEFFLFLLFYTFTAFFMFFVLLIMFFLLAGGRYSFIGNRIFATLGYPKPWSHNTSAEHERFKKLNRSGDPELYDDPQTPEFERIKIRDAKATYYCRTPIVPDWVEVIDERDFTPDIDNPPPKINYTEQ